MSEPYAAFVKLPIARADLIHWLDAPVPAASHWEDWRSIGGRWYFKELQDIADIGEAELQSKIARCDRDLLAYATNRDAVRSILNASMTPLFRYAKYDPEARDFVAGTLTYSENLIDFIVFLAIMRGAAAFLQPDGHGIAVIHNYVWGREDENRTKAAVRIGPGEASGFMDKTERGSAAKPFQAIADHMLNGEAGQPQDELDGLK